MKQLDDFLADGSGQAEAATPSAAEQQSQATEDPPVAEAGEAAPPNAADPAKAADPPEEAVEEPEDVVGLRKALQSVRAERRDYKGERDRLQGERDALLAQIAAASQAPPPPAPVQQRPVEPPPPVRVPNPAEDPEGYAAFQDARFEQRLYNERLNISERLLRDKVDGADVDAKIALFKKEAEANPALRAQLSNHPDPYRFAYEVGQRTAAMAEIGTDPAAYRAKVEADIRAKIEAEYAAETGTERLAAPAVRLPTSLGTARSAAPRSAPVWTGPEDLGDILRPRKR